MTFDQSRKFFSNVTDVPVRGVYGPISKDIENLMTIGVLRGDVWNNLYRSSVNKFTKQFINQIIRRIDNPNDIIDIIIGKEHEGEKS